MMRKNILRMVIVSVLSIAGIQTASAGETNQSGMNTNKPRADDKLGSKEPAYKSMNSNKPAANASLTGVSNSDLKIKPRPEQTTGKEPAKGMNENTSPVRLNGVTAKDLKMPPKVEQTTGKEPAN